MNQRMVPVDCSAVDLSLAGMDLTLPGQILLPADLNPYDGNWSTGCVICGYPFTHLHHLKPREWGGGDNPSNLAYLCPNHHAAVHALMAWWMAGRQCKSSAQWMHLKRCATDIGLCELWELEIKGILETRVRDLEKECGPDAQGA